MYQRAVLVGACGALAACAAQPAPTTATSTQEMKRVCRTVEDGSTGTLIGSRQECEMVPADQTGSPSDRG